MALGVKKSIRSWGKDAGALRPRLFWRSRASCLTADPPRGGKRDRNDQNGKDREGDAAARHFHESTVSRCICTFRTLTLYDSVASFKRPHGVGGRNACAHDCSGRRFLRNGAVSLECSAGGVPTNSDHERRFRIDVNGSHGASIRHGTAWLAITSEPKRRVWRLTRWISRISRPVPTYGKRRSGK